MLRLHSHMLEFPLMKVLLESLSASRNSGSRFIQLFAVTVPPPTTSFAPLA